MSSRPEDPNAVTGGERQWRPEPEVAPASGGHLAPDVHDTGALFDPTSRTRDRTQAMPPIESERRPRPRADRRKRTPVRRVKRTVRHIDPLSVFKMSLFLYGIAVVAWLIFVAILYALVNSTGIFQDIEDIRRGLAIEGRLDIDLMLIERWALLIGLVFWVVGSLANLVISFLYNVGADLLGGVEATFVEKDI